jgi:hypothetical protein
MFINTLTGTHFLNGTVFKDDVGRITALRLANTDPYTHHTSYTVLSHPQYSNCFEKSNPMLLDDISTQWVPSEPLSTWDREELAEELVDCKNSFRVLKHRHINQARNLYSIKKTLWNRINAIKAIKTTPKPEKKIALRPSPSKVNVHVDKPYVAPPKTIIYKEPERKKDALRHNLVVPITRMSPVVHRKKHHILHKLKKKLKKVKG